MKPTSLCLVLIVLGAMSCAAFNAQAAISAPTGVCNAAREGTSSCNASACYVCSSSAWLAQPTIIGSTTEACATGKAGLLRWTGTGVQVCDGTNWATLTGSGGGANLFGFPDTQGALASQTITSTALTLSASSSGQTATCGTNCTGIVRNGTSVGTTTTGLAAGDTLAIMQTSASSQNTKTTATVAIGTTAIPWNATTYWVGPISFTDSTGAFVGLTATSNTITLTGTFSNVTATCGTGCTGILRGGANFGTTTLLSSGMTIAIQQIASTSANTTTSATLMVGTTTSSPWSVTTSNNIPNSFSFTDQTGVLPNSTATSNALTLTGTFAGLSATCGANCTGIARNNTWYGTTATGFKTGDTIAIALLSSSSPTTATTANVTVGSTTSGSWSVTTSNNTPNSLSFTDQTVTSLIGATVYSDNITLTGTFSGLTATCTGCTNIARNGTWLGTTTATGFATGDTIAIAVTKPTIANTTATASVTVGATTSSTWTVSVGACTSLSGLACSDGTLYVGLSPDTSTAMYAMPCDLGMSGTRGACTGTRATYVSATAYNSTGFTSLTTGKANTAGLVAAYGTAVPAAYACTQQTYGGHSDWYLPALNELNLFWSQSAGWMDATYGSSFDLSGNWYWSSSEYDVNNSYLERFKDGYQTTAYKKVNSDYVRCVRR